MEEKRELEQDEVLEEVKEKIREHEDLELIIKMIDEINL